MPIIHGGSGAGKLAAIYDTLLDIDFSTSSNTFVDMLAVQLTPVPNDSLQIMAQVSFSVTGIIMPALVSFRLSSDTDGDYNSVSHTIAAAGQKSTVFLLYQKNGAADDNQNISIQCKTTGGTIQCRPVTIPNDESAVLIVNEINPNG